MQAFMVNSNHGLRTCAVLACVLSGCVLFEPETRPCRKSSECPPDSGIGGASGEGGEGGAAGADSGSGGDGGSSGTGGSGGQGGAGTGGAGGAGGSPAPCDDACSATELCDEDRDVCVDCIEDADCDEGVCMDDECVQCRADDDCDGAAAPACDTDENTCVECTDNEHCSGDAELCDTELQQCVECLSDGDCNDASASRCDAGSCKPCTESTQCGHLEDTTVCDTSGTDGVCVQCTGSSFDACGTAPGGTPYVCNVETKICSTEEQGSALACEPCIADAQCRAGTACMQTKFGSIDTGNFCLWRQDAAGAGAPNGDCVATRQFVATEDEWMSIEGVTTTVCRPGVTTCQGQNDFRSKTCSGANATGHAQCGVPGVDDAYCAPFGGSQHFCTVPCASHLDCRDTRPGPNSDTECEMETLGSTDILVCQFD